MIFLSDTDCASILADRDFTQKFLRYTRTRLRRVRHSAENFILPPAGFPSKWRWDWERNSNAIYCTLIILAQVKDLARHDDECCRTLASAIPWIGQVRSHILASRDWRPGGPTPEEPYDFNNWSNGFVPGSLGLACAILGDVPSEAVHAFMTRGASWLSHSSFPVAQHWGRRSTNHGIVIYSAFLVGAHALGVDETEALRNMDNAWHQIMEDAIPDGSFGEGLHYFGFAMAHAIPLVFLKWNKSGHDWRRFARKLNMFSETTAFLSHTTAGSGRPIANFGDAFQQEWSDTGPLRLASALSGTALAPHIPRAPMPNTYHGAMDFCLPVPPAAEMQDGAMMSIFGHRRLASIDFYEAGAKRSGLFVFGSKRHITHSRDHDCGGFTLELDGEPTIESLHGMSALYGNSVLGARDGEFIDFPEPRDYDGEIWADRRGIKVATTFNSAFRRRTGIRAMERIFRPTWNNSRLVIETTVMANTQPVLTFNRRRDAAVSITCEDSDGVALQERNVEGVTCFIAAQGEGARTFVTTISPAAK